MKRVLAVTLASLVVSACAVEPRALGSFPQREVLVVLKDDGGQPLPVGSKRGYRGDAAWPVSLHTLARAQGVARDHGLRRVDAWPIPPLGLFCVVLELADGQNRREVIEQLSTDPRVSQVQDVNEFHAMLSKAYNDPLVDLQYGSHEQELESVHAITTGTGVRIGIVDSNVDAQHEDLRGQIAAQFPSAREDDPQSLRHGTAVAGVIAAAGGNGEGVVGLAPGATVTVYAGCRETTGGAAGCTTVSLAKAIGRATEDHSDVINLSLAGPPDWLLERLLSYAHAHGAVIVAAYNDAAGQSFPASLSFVHSARPDAGPWFASQEQFSTRAGGGYQVFFGSSMSAAGVTGVAALLRTRWSEAETESILDTLLTSGCRAAGASDAPLHRVVAHEPCAR